MPSFWLEQICCWKLVLHHFCCLFVCLFRLWVESKAVEFCFIFFPREWACVMVWWWSRMTSLYLSPDREKLQCGSSNNETTRFSVTTNKEQKRTATSLFHTEDVCLSSSGHSWNIHWNFFHVHFLPTDMMTCRSSRQYFWKHAEKLKITLNEALSQPKESAVLTL